MLAYCRGRRIADHDAHHERLNLEGLLVGERGLDFCEGGAGPRCERHPRECLCDCCGQNQCDDFFSIKSGGHQH